MRLKPLQTGETDEPQKRGVGDLLATIIARTGLSRFAPKNCKCEQRQAWLNRVFSLRKH